MTAAARVAVPILNYHTISDDPGPHIAPFAVRPAAFARQLDLIVEGGHTALTVSEYAAVLDGVAALPPRPVVVTFDDGFVDNLTLAAPMLAARGLPATVFVATGHLPGCPGGPAGHSLGPMVPWSRLAELEGAGLEVGAHSHSHPQLDVLAHGAVTREIAQSKDLLEETLGHPVTAFAYPHGYADGWAQAEVRRLGFLVACGVRNALSHPGDNRWLLSRLVLGPTTSLDQVAAWLAGAGAPLASVREQLRTKAWRAARRVGAGR